LQSAWENLASQKECAELLEVEGWRPEFGEDRPKSFFEGAARIAEAVGAIQSKSREATEIRAAFEDRILDALFNEDLYGFGYPVSPSPARMPRRIDPAFWDGCELVWNDGKAWLDNIFYNRIRIINPEDYPQFVLSPKKPGPISHADEINRAIAYHTENETDFWTKSETIRIMRMRRSIEEKFGIDTESVRGFSDKTFEKYLLEFRKANL
tara:strand:- start:2584 stop:3213 length:630 start_codon:yes stop_codon:yes gene_type:complete